MIRLPTVDELRAGFTDPPAGSAPMVRWWWFGPSVERSELDRELSAMAAAGFGGVEISYVYPLEPATTTFLSDDHLADLRYAADRAHELGLRFDLTLGSGWSFGGAHVTPELAARALHWDRREIQPGALTVPVVSPWPGDELVAAYVGAGSIQEQPDHCDRLPVVDGVIMVPEGQGTRQVLLVYARLTGQNVKRAAFGAEGAVLDHYSAAAAQEHLHRVADPLLDAVPAHLVGSVFCDSLEVYESDWTPELLAEFTRRRGYDPLPELYRLVIDGPGAAKLRADYHQTLTQLYQDHFVAVFQRWAARRGVPFRIQGYGTPPATVSSYRFADLFEGEGWGWTEITQTRWATSAAHLYGRDVVSSETWTWVHSPSFRATPLDLKGEAHEHLLAGVNQLIGHGWPYSPADRPGLGWFFYAAGALDDRNPWWPAMPALNRYLTRLCWLLRQGEPVADVLVYVPNRDLFARMGAAVGGSLDAWREANRWIGDDIPRTLRTGGWDYDLVDDDATEVVDPDRPRVVVVPRTSTVPGSTRRWLDAVVASGGSVIMVDSTVEINGAVRCAPADLAVAVSAAIRPDVQVSPSTDIGVVHRRGADVAVYLVVNTGPTTRTFTLAARDARTGYEEWDADTGAVRRSGPTGDGVEVTLHPYQATVLIMTDAPPSAPTGDGRDGRAVAAGGGRRLDLDVDWQVQFADGDAEAVTLPHVWEDQPGRTGYSGAAAYRTTVELTDPDASGRVLLDLGDPAVVDAGSAEVGGMRGHSYRAMISAPVREVAEVRVNDVACGVLWAPPYTVDVTDAVRPGVNTVEIIVHNTAANRLAQNEEIHALAADSEQRYGRRFRMQELEHAMDTVCSGLLKAPTVVITG